MSNIDKLRQAQDLVKSVFDTLDLGTKICLSCGHRHSVDKQARTQHEVLKSAFDKIGKICDWMEKKE